MIRIYKGDDSDFADLNSITVTLTTEMDLTGYTGSFSFLGIEKSFTSVQIASKRVSFAYDAEETSGFVPGENFGKFTLVDPLGRRAAVQKILVLVMTHKACGGLPPNTVSIDIENEYDYGKLRNKPKINGITVEGEKAGRAYRLNRIMAYSSASSYDVGDQVLHGTQFYECTTAIPSGEAWTDGHWRLLGGATGATDRVKISDLKAAVSDPKDMLLSPASIKAYLQGMYDAIQAIMPG